MALYSDFSWFDTIKKGLHARIERMRFRYTPPLAEWVVNLSTYQARTKLRMSGPISVLVDTNIFGKAVTHETAWISNGVEKWGTHEIDTGYAARIPVHAADCDTREYKNIQHLAGIAYLARKGFLSLKTSGELEAERFRQPAGRYTGYDIFDYGIFNDIPLESVDGLAASGSTSYGPDRPSVAAQQRERLAESDDEIYRSLVGCLGSKHSQDAWHIRTAEVHGLFCFLTMDFRLRDAIERHSQSEPIQSLNTRVMTPLELAAYFGLVPVPPHILSYNDTSHFVRSDVHWPSNERRPRTGQRKPQ